eukprot:10021092-Karenia_brevis.AAC.1
MRRAQVFRRHRLNNRDQHTSRARYKEVVKQRGFVLGGRNEIVGVPPESTSMYRDIAAGMHVIEAIYDADDEEGDKNEQVQATIEEGLEITDLDARSPDDII